MKTKIIPLSSVNQLISLIDQPISPDLNACFIIGNVDFGLYGAATAHGLRSAYPEFFENTTVILSGIFPLSTLATLTAWPVSNRLVLGNPQAIIGSFLTGMKGDASDLEITKEHVEDITKQHIRLAAVDTFLTEAEIEEMTERFKSTSIKDGELITKGLAGGRYVRANR